MWNLHMYDLTRVINIIPRTGDIVFGLSVRPSETLFLPKITS